jgi:hypothetical protein
MVIFIIHHDQTRMEYICSRIILHMTYAIASMEIIPRQVADIYRTILYILCQYVTESTKNRHPICKILNSKE